MGKLENIPGFTKLIDETKDDLGITIKEIEIDIEKNQKMLAGLEKEIEELTKRVKSQRDARTKGLEVNNDEGLLASIQERADELKEHIAIDSAVLADSRLLVHKFRKTIFSENSNKDLPIS